MLRQRAAESRGTSLTAVAINGARLSSFDLQGAEQTVIVAGTTVRPSSDPQ